MSTIRPEYLSPDHSDCSATLDVLLRQEPDDEEEDKEEDKEEEDDDEEDYDGYSE